MHTCTGWEPTTSFPSFDQVELRHLTTSHPDEPPPLFREVTKNPSEQVTLVRELVPGSLYVREVWTPRIVKDHLEPYTLPTACRTDTRSLFSSSFKIQGIVRKEKRF